MSSLDDRMDRSGTLAMSMIERFQAKQPSRSTTSIPLSSYYSYAALSTTRLYEAGCNGVEGHFQLAKFGSKE